MCLRAREQIGEQTIDETVHMIERQNVEEMIGRRDLPRLNERLDESQHVESCDDHTLGRTARAARVQYDRFFLFIRLESKQVTNVLEWVDYKRFVETYGIRRVKSALFYSVVDHIVFRQERLQARLIRIWFVGATFFFTILFRI